MSVGIGTQFTASLASGQTQTCFTWGWDPNYLLYWSMRPTTQSAQVRLDSVALEYGELGLTYFLTVSNTGSTPATFEARYYFKTIIGEESWRNLGPDHLSGCIVQVTIDPNDSDRLYAVAQGGGLWRLDSVGNYPATSWTPLSDQHSSLIGFAIAIPPANSSVIYLAEGNELLRSNNGGSTWASATTTALWADGEDPWGHAVRRIATDSASADRVFVASNTGLWHTTNGGTTWAELLSGDVTDVAVDPGNAAIVYAAQRGVGVVKSTTTGASWTTIQPWGSANMVKIALGAQGGPSNRTVALKFDARRCS